MGQRGLLLASLASLSLALLAFGLADTRAIDDEHVAWACGDWWCAPGNTLPVGLGIFLGGLGLVGLCIALVGGADEEPEPEAPTEPRGHEGRSRRPLWSSERPPRRDGR